MRKERGGIVKYDPPI